MELDGVSLFPSTPLERGTFLLLPPRPASLNILQLEDDNAESEAAFLGARDLITSIL